MKNSKNTKGIGKTQLKDLFLKRYKELDWHKQGNNLVAYLRTYIMGIQVEKMTFTLSKHTVTIVYEGNSIVPLKYTFKLEDEKYYTELAQKAEESDIQKCTEYINEVLQRQKEQKEKQAESEKQENKQETKQELSGEKCGQIIADESNAYKNLSPVTTIAKPTTKPSKNKNAVLVLLPFIAGIIGLCFFAFYCK